jgi:hypothetical protein
MILPDRFPNHRALVARNVGFRAVSDKVEDRRYIGLSEDPLSSFHDGPSCHYSLEKASFRAR